MKMHRFYVQTRKGWDPSLAELYAPDRECAEMVVRDVLGDDWADSRPTILESPFDVIDSTYGMVILNGMLVEFYEPNGCVCYMSDWTRSQELVDKGYLRRVFHNNYEDFYLVPGCVD